MRRLEIHSYGPLRASVRFADVPMPAVGNQDILVKVLAAGINPIDYKIVMGDLRRVQTLNLPAPFGFDCCGTIEAVGSEVQTFARGDAVYARLPRTRMGSFAEYVAVEAKYVARAPVPANALECASLPLVALTTLQALVDRAQARPGQHILIHAGSGGLGSFAVQYAKHHLGLHVTSTTSSKNADWVKGLGADVVIAYDREDYTASPMRYDMVFDTLGGKTTRESFSVLKQGGVVVSVAGPPDREFPRQVGAGPLVAAVMWVMGLPIAWRARSSNGRYFRFLTESSGSQLEHISQVVAAGKVRALVDKVYPFDQAIEALEQVQTGRTRGKIVIQMAHL